MDITRKHLDEAASAGLISPAQAGSLWDFLAARGHEQARFGFTHILYYLGGLIAIGAMSLFMTLGWESFGGWGLFAIALSYAAAGLWLTEYFLRGKDLKIPAGITATFVIVLVPLAVYGLQHGLGFWPAQDGMAYRQYHERVDWRWIIMELSTLACGAALLWRYRLPFMVMPIAVTLWYMSMDLTPFLFGEDATWDKRKAVSIVVGLAITALALLVDVRSRRNPDFGFWLYLFGVMAFWGGLTMLDSKQELGKFFYMLLNLGLIGLGAALARRVFVVFGGLGVAGYLGHLSYSVFKDSLLFPFALTCIGLGIIALGVLWQRHEAAIGTRLRGVLPAPLRELADNAA
ncbi:MAG: DUF2157 domain-containing protein [Proteobacteria bacterium]|nr:DUF2157 domain-containing protein [Pseudomonadota bacterium]